MEFEFVLMAVVCVSIMNDDDVSGSPFVIGPTLVVSAN